VLEGERGLVAAASQSTAADIQTAMASLGTDFMVQRNFFKRYPCNRGIFQGLDAVAALATRTHIAADEVEAVTVRLASTSAWMVNNPAPTSIFEAKFSLHFAIATLLTVGRLGFAEYADRWLNDPQVRDLMGRVQLVVDDALAADAAIVEIHTRGGQRLEGEGTWRNLPLSEVEHKFRSVVGGLLDAARAARLVDLVYELPRAHSTVQFFEALAGTAALYTREGETS
jgi:2-methylcitrate dehydratase PrpD